MTWDIADENNPKLRKVSEWINLTDYRTLEARTGVYIFADDDFDVKYIGKAGGRRMVVESDNDTIKNLFEVYSAIYRKKGTGATKVKALYTYRDTQALTLEGELIKKYSPPNNGIDLLNS